MTRNVKARRRGRSVEKPRSSHYNLRVITAGIRGRSVLALLCAPLLMGGACEKKPSTAGDTGAAAALDRADPSKPVDTTPLEGIDVSKLSEPKQKLFYQLVDSLSSPCGKAHSLRTSVKTDTQCKRAPFAVKYVLAWLEDEAPEEMVRKEYAAKYIDTPRTAKIEVSKAPRMGNPDAGIKLVEFYDYACSHCASFKQVTDRLVADYGGKLGIFFKMYPTGNWPESKSAAQASLAANAQGKFKEMHAILFQQGPAGHGRDAVLGHARQLGLDLAKFEADYNAAAAQVENDRAEGVASGVEHTPTIFFNDRIYEGPPLQKYIQLWIDEELAVNR